MACEDSIVKGSHTDQDEVIERNESSVVRDEDIMAKGSHTEEDEVIERNESTVVRDEDNMAKGSHSKRDEVSETNDSNIVRDDDEPMSVGIIADDDQGTGNDVKETCPYVGMEFETHEQAYVFYNRYAGQTGFSVRKNTTTRSKINREMIGQTFCCSHEGMRDSRAKSFEESSRNAIARTGCKAMMTIRKKKNETKWIITKVVEEHNHALVAPSKRHLLRSQRYVEQSKKKIMDYIELIGIKPNPVAIEAGEVQNVDLIRKDANNYLTSKRKKEFTNEDAQAVLDHLQQQQVEDPTFYYAIQVDSEGRIANFFWTDAKSRMDYHYFGDVVCFDPSYGIIRYGVPFVPIVGINHHYQTVTFGGALLYSKTEESFMWVMKSWMAAMNGKQPNVILTDQESTIGASIDQILPRTRHRYGMWHINRNALKNLSHETNKYPNFYQDFSKCLHEYATVNEFQYNWNAMIEEYNLQENAWLMNLFQNREKWAPVYTRDTFCADMCTAQRSENTNAYFDKYLKRGMPIFEFVRQYERALVDSRETENKEDHESNHTRPVLKYSMEIEKEAARFYTRTIFKKFQEQLFEGFSYRHRKTEMNETKSVYSVWMEGYEQQKCIVTFEPSTTTVKCSCQMFEFEGYLCRHILKIFVVEDVQKIPEQYILKRWTKDAKFGSMVFSRGQDTRENPEENVASKYSKLCQEGFNIASKASPHSEVYELAMRGLQNTLRDVEVALKTLSLTSEAHSCDVSATCAHLDVQNPLVDPKHKEQPEKQIARLDKGGTKRKKSANSENIHKKASNTASLQSLDKGPSEKDLQVENLSEGFNMNIEQQPSCTNGFRLPSLNQDPFMAHTQQSHNLVHGQQPYHQDSFVDGYNFYIQQHEVASTSGNRQSEQGTIGAIITNPQQHGGNTTIHLNNFFQG